MTPGLVDAHLHLLAWARSLDEVALAGAASRREALGRVAAFLAAEPGAGPVSGRGWDANDWSEPPERASLDAVSGERPVLLHSQDYHALWVNSAALREAGVTRATPDPAGGRIERDATGEPTGVVREHAVRLFARSSSARAVRGSDPERLDARGAAAARARRDHGARLRGRRGAAAAAGAHARPRPGRACACVAHLPHGGPRGRAGAGARERRGGRPLPLRRR